MCPQILGVEQKTKNFQLFSRVTSEGKTFSVQLVLAETPAFSSTCLYQNNKFRQCHVTPYENQPGEGIWAVFLNILEPPQKDRPNPLSRRPCPQHLTPSPFILPLKLHKSTPVFHRNIEIIIHIWYNPPKAAPSTIPKRRTSRAEKAESPSLVCLTALFPSAHGRQHTIYITFCLIRHKPE